MKIDFVVFEAVVRRIKMLLKEIIKNFGMDVARFLLKIYFIFPINNRRVIFQSYIGKQYSCNPKYISEYLIKCDEQYEVIWSFEKPKLYKDLEKQGIKVIGSKGFFFWYYRLTAKVTVTNVMWKNYTPVRKGQYEIQTWHGGGGGYKKTLADDKEETKKKITIKRHLKNFERYSLVLTSSATSLRTNARTAMHYRGIVLGGTARNDMLINHDRPYIDRKVRGYYGLESDVHIVLYAPTWRKDARKEDFDVDYNAVRKAFTDRFGGTWVVFRRMHWMAAEFFKDSTKDYISAESYPDMQELLYTVDALISDYSSSIWDFSFTGKPCFLFCTDLGKFKEDRDFYNPITTWGFPLAENNSELVDRILQFDEKKYAVDMEEQHIKNMAFENGHTTENVCKIIQAVCYGDGKLPEGLPYQYYAGELD